MIKKEYTIDAWKDTLRYLIQEGKDFTDKDKRLCREILNVKIEILNTEGIKEPIEIVSNNKKWVYPRTDEIANSTLSRKDNPGHIYVCGQRIFNFNEEINQIDNFVIPLLSKDKTTRRAVINLWNPRKDSNIFNKEVPSLLNVTFIKNDTTVDATAVIRSNNLLFGFPANIFQVYLLMEYVAQRIDRKSGKITLFLLSAHLFEEQFDYVRELIA